jgi:hypothetical protein
MSGFLARQFFQNLAEILGGETGVERAPTLFAVPQM